ncbi:uncharacterized protein LOC125847086 [Solanum stenotomum]|uniref:uncharacterized protein LOC125847086 n=1 Tax=Solanum stenotomum TaxID=172797 RepID=UPI0020D1C0D8|nr:uncharacterized protein LOC125847086 [Solanum stenotomum]
MTLNQYPNQQEKRKKGVEVTMSLQQIPRPPLPFPPRLKKKAEDGKFAKFITMLRQLSMNIPLVEALEQMPGYVKFMKDLVMKKRAVSIDFTDNVHHCSASAIRLLVQKKKDSGAFTTPCTIGSIKFSKALCDLGANINLMPLAIYKQLGLGIPKSTSMRLMMADRSVKRLVGRPFLAIGQTLVDVEIRELKFRLNKEEVNFKICRSMKQPHDMNMVSPIEAFDEEEMGATIEERLAVETLVAVLMNFEVDFRTDYVEIVNAL